MSTTPTSPFAALSEQRDTIITITEQAMVKLRELRDTEPDAEKLGLRLAIASQPGEDFRYDLAFEEFLTAAMDEEVRTIDGFKVIIPGRDVEALQGAQLDYSDNAGLVIRNPNKPRAPQVEGLVTGDDVSRAIEEVVRVEVNPALAAHGGFVTFAGHDSQGTAYFTMGGGCHGCSMSRQTMLEGVQTMIADKVPSISRVRDLTDHSTGENPYYT